MIIILSMLSIPMDLQPRSLELPVHIGPMLSIYLSNPNIIYIIIHLVKPVIPNEF